MSEVFHHALKSGTRIAQYEIRIVLGAGGFGVTYLAWDTLLECKVALKEFLPNELAIRQDGSKTVIPRSSGDAENFAYGLNRFLNEARTLAKFREPNLIRVQAFLEANGTAYMVMDYEEGETLSAYLDRIGTLEEATLKGIIIPILDGLRAVHAADFLHRDIKPGNIYLRRNGPPVLIDFGAARQALGEHSRSMTGIVTAGYAPFEQYSTRGKQGPWTDLYAIGATLYRCISGHAPVESAERMAAFSEGEADPLVPASELKRGQYSPELLSAIDWMLKPAAKDRPQRVEDVLRLLLGQAGLHTARESSASTTSVPLLLSPMSSASTLSPLNTPAAFKSRHLKSPAMMAVMGLFIIGLAGGGVWGYLHQNATPAPIDWSVRLSVCAELLKANQLTTPAEKNANDCYRVESYLDWGEAALKESNYAKVKQSLEGARKVSPEDPRIAPLETRLMQAEQQMNIKTLALEMVTINGAFNIGKYEVTQKQWQAVMGSNPSFFSSCGNNCPVEKVSWDNVQAFLTKLNQMTGRHYRLPTEKEWERACGSGTEYCGGNNPDAVAWYSNNSGGKTQPVGRKQANANGVYDMTGNVWEWTSGCWEGDCSRRVYRGRSWNSTAENLRAAFPGRGTTDFRYFSLGFRLAQDL